MLRIRIAPPACSPAEHNVPDITVMHPPLPKAVECCQHAGPEEMPWQNSPSIRRTALLILTWERWTHSDQTHCSPACSKECTRYVSSVSMPKPAEATHTPLHIPRQQVRVDSSAHLWLGRFTGLGAVTFPRDTMRLPGLVTTTEQVSIAIEILQANISHACQCAHAAARRCSSAEQLTVPRTLGETS